MKIYREKHSRHLWQVEVDEKWSINYLQVGKAVEKEDGLRYIFDLTSFLISNKIITLPHVEVYGNIKCHTGYSGCQTFYQEFEPKVWYDTLPIADSMEIVERRYKKPNLDLLHISMSDKLNSGLSISQDTFWSIIWIYLYKIRHIEVPEDYEGSELEYLSSWWGNVWSCPEKEWLTVEDCGVKVKVGCQTLKMAPDRSFLLWNHEGKIHRFTVGYPTQYHGRSDSPVDFIKANMDVIVKSLNAIDLQITFLSETSLLIHDLTTNYRSDCLDYPYFYMNGNVYYQDFIFTPATKKDAPIWEVDAEVYKNISESFGVETFNLIPPCENIENLMQVDRAVLGKINFKIK